MKVHSSQPVVLPNIHISFTANFIVEFVYILYQINLYTCQIGLIQPKDQSNPSLLRSKLQFTIFDFNSILLMLIHRKGTINQFTVLCEKYHPSLNRDPNYFSVSLEITFFILDVLYYNT